MPDFSPRVNVHSEAPSHNKSTDGATERSQVGNVNSLMAHAGKGLTNNIVITDVSLVTSAQAELICIVIYFNHSFASCLCLNF